MHRTIGYLSKRFVQVRPGEGRKVLLTFLYFFLIITAYYVIKPVSRSLVLGELGFRIVPYVDLICAIVMGPVVTLFARLVDRLQKPQLVSLAFWTAIGMLLVFWRVLGHPAPWLAGVFYVWVAIFSVLVVTLFWLVANDLYRPREAKRLFGFIGSGGILGGVVGSSIAAVGAQVVGTEHLPALSAGILFLSWLVVQRLWKRAPEREGLQPSGAAEARPDPLLSHSRVFFRLVFQSRYLVLLVALVGLTKMVATLVYYQFNPFIEQTFPDVNAKTTFTGLFFGGMNVASFLIQFFFTSWILRRWGLRVALLLLPAGLAFGVTGFFVLPVFWLAAVTELYDGSMNYSLQQTTKEVLYLPIDRSIRYKVKPFIDMVVFRFGKGLAALVGVLLLDVWGASPRVISCLLLPLVVVWLIVAVQLSKHYVVTIRTTLQARAAARRSPAPPDGGSLFGPLTDLQPTARKLELVDRLVTTNDTAPLQTKELLSGLKAYEAFPVDPSPLGSEAPRLKAVISDRKLPISVRRQATRLLARLAEQVTVDYLFALVLVEEDALLRREAVLGLVRLRLHGGRLEFPVQPIRRHIASEVDTYQRIVAVASIYRKHYHGPLAPDDPVMALLRALMEESVEQIFRLLMLLHRPEDIHLVYEQMRVADSYLRSDAIELLDNLVDAAMRALLVPILDEDRFLASLEEAAGLTEEPTAAYRVLQEAIWDHDCWLSVTTLCAVGRLRLTTMRQELERASREGTPFISTAAKVALHLAAHS